jgi:hypothetical protein
MSQSPRLGGVSPEETALEQVDILRRHRVAMGTMGLLEKIGVAADDPLVAVDLWRERCKRKGDLVAVEEGGLIVARTRIVGGCVEVQTTRERVYQAAGLEVFPYLAFSQPEADYVRDAVVQLESTRARLASARAIDFGVLPSLLATWGDSYRL